MRLLTTSAVVLFVSGGAALACPSSGLATGSMPFSGALQSLGVTAGGTNTLDACGLGGLGFGQFRSAPDFTFNVSGVAGQTIDLAVRSECDPALLVNTPSGEWLFNDDSNGLNPGLSVPGMDGVLDVWVGTFAGGDCAATLDIQVGGGAVAGGGGAPAPAPVPVPVPAPAPAPAPVPVPVPAPVPAIPATCPDPSMIGPSLTLTGADLLSPQAYVAQVSAGQELFECNLNVDAWGFTSQAPQFTLNMSGMAGYTFVAELDTPCDPTLLLHANGQWYFNDDGPEDLQSLLEVSGAGLDGKVDIWVGTFGGDTCQGTITFTTLQGDTGGGGQTGGGTGACPDPTLMGQVINTDGPELYSPDTYRTVAGGNADIAACGLPGFGFASVAPNFTVNLSGMEEYGRLEIEGVDGCDTTLLARTPDGQWHYDDDGNGNLLPLLNLTSGAGLNGRLDIWVGTYGGESCDASIELESWFN